MFPQKSYKNKTGFSFRMIEPHPFFFILLRGPSQISKWVVTNSRVHAIKILLEKSSIKLVRKKKQILLDLSRLIKQGSRRIVLIVFV